jgi:hypothetical protein
MNVPRPRWVSRNRDHQLFRQFAMGRQFVAGLHAAERDGLPNLPHDLAVDRGFVGGFDEELHYWYITLYHQRIDPVKCFLLGVVPS